MPEYLLMGDIHLSDRPPSSCTDTYQDDIFTILEAVADIAHARKSTSVFWAGDIFHHKTPSRTSHRTIIRLIEVARRFSPIPVYVVPGNHDMLNDRLHSIGVTQPLGVVIASGAVRLLDGWRGTTPIYGQPWLQRFTDETVTDALAEYRSRDVPGLIITHAPLYPLGKELEFEHFPADRWADAMGNQGSVYYGHIHTPHGIHTAGGVTFCNAGAISRGSLHEYNLTRSIQIAAWSFKTHQFELIDVPHKPAAEVFRLAEAEQVKTSQRVFDEFMDSIGQARLDITSIEAVAEHIRGLDIHDRLKKTALEFLEEATP